MSYPDIPSIQKKLERLKALRKRLGWSEETCARELGVSYSTMSRWERGESIPNSQVVLNAIDRLIATYDTQDSEGG